MTRSFMRRYPLLALSSKLVDNVDLKTSSGRTEKGMSVEHLLRRLGNQAAIENARLATTELSRRRVEREDVEIFLEQLYARRHGLVDHFGSAVADR
jgi:hypothetical protein